jgi:hypothetical protein
MKQAQMKQAQMKQANPLAVVLCGVALLSFAGTGLAAADAEQHAVLDVCAGFYSLAYYADGKQAPNSDGTAPAEHSIGPFAQKVDDELKRDHIPNSFAIGVTPDTPIMAADKKVRESEDGALAYRRYWSGKQVGKDFQKTDDVSGAVSFIKKCIAAYRSVATVSAQRAAGLTTANSGSSVTGVDAHSSAQARHDEILRCYGFQKGLRAVAETSPIGQSPLLGLVTAGAELSPGQKDATMQGLIDSERRVSAFLNALGDYKDVADYRYVYSAEHDGQVKAWKAYLISDRTEEHYAAQIEPAKVDRLEDEGASRAAAFYKDNDPDAAVAYINRCLSIYDSLSK